MAGADAVVVDGIDVRNMAIAVGDLVRYERFRLHDTEFLLLRHCTEPSPELALAGWRLMIERADRAQRLLTSMIPHAIEIQALLESVR